MRRSVLAGLALLLFSACVENLETPTPVVERNPILASTAPGDSIRYTLSLAQPVKGAASYAWTTTASPAGWSGMLSGTTTTALSIPFTAINLTAWDSVQFTACVTASRPGKTSAPGCVSWSLTRLGTPGIPQVDSSLVIASIRLLPDAPVIVTGTQLQFCPFAKALDGKVRFISGYQTLQECQTYYDTFPASERLPGYPVAMSQKPVSEWMDGGPAGGLRIVIRTPLLELCHFFFEPIYRYPQPLT